MSKFRMYIFFLKVIGLDNMSNKNVQKYMITARILLLFIIKKQGKNNKEI